ncbi:hypothetical protein RvY_11903 [Ramazzottius varieornatus]|uniref:L-Fucosyltransferase n=1 Tax=Ramazzottius varieornatus TaxID=947166 RepID=A0A1D1VN29_RAMVA|nr:hypothetical protein RvY_11903 [Ramazzottius varieornatus]
MAHRRTCAFTRAGLCCYTALVGSLVYLWIIRCTSIVTSAAFFLQTPWVGKTSVEQELQLGNASVTEGNHQDDDTSVRNSVQLILQRLSSLTLQRFANAGKHLVRMNTTNSLFDDTLYLTPLMYDGGLGNFMFITASSWGLAQNNQRTMSFFETYWAEKYFLNLGIPHVNVSVWSGKDNTTIIGDDIRTNFTMYENYALAFETEMTEINGEFGNTHVALGGYLQSWKYFHQYRDEIRSLFTFHRSIHRLACLKLRTHLNEHYNKALNLSVNVGIPHRNLASPTLIGIHVRRGDILDPLQLKHGHQPASEEYLLRAPLKLQSRYKDALFLVVSNDMEYCQKLYQGLDNYIFMTPLNDWEPDAVDMAILTLMDHLILTVGTYGWWAAYLSDAKDVFYFKDWPRVDSDMRNASNAEDYFLPSWKPFV